MKRHNTFIIFLSIIIITMLVSSCGSTQTGDSAPPSTTPPVPQQTEAVVPAGEPSATPDLCAPENIEPEVEKVHKFMREFDDASVLAANVPKEQLGDAIANLQKIRRESEDQMVPPCLVTLKTHQVTHMNTVINTLIAFMGGNDQATVDQGIALARQQHDNYTIELARVLGITVVPAEELMSTPAP